MSAEHFPMSPKHKLQLSLSCFRWWRCFSALDITMKMFYWFYHHRKLLEHKMELQRYFIFNVFCLSSLTFIYCLFTVQMVTDLSVVSGSPSIEIQPGHKASFTLSVSPWKRGKLTGDFISPALVWLQRCSFIYSIFFTKTNGHRHS